MANIVNTVSNGGIAGASSLEQSMKDRMIEAKQKQASTDRDEDKTDEPLVFYFSLTMPSLVDEDEEGALPQLAIPMVIKVPIHRSGASGSPPPLQDPLSSKAKGITMLRQATTQTEEMNRGQIMQYTPGMPTGNRTSERVDIDASLSSSQLNSDARRTNTLGPNQLTISAARLPTSDSLPPTTVAESQPGSPVEITSPSPRRYVDTSMDSAGMPTSRGSSNANSPNDQRDDDGAASNLAAASMAGQQTLARATAPPSAQSAWTTNSGLQQRADSSTMVGETENLPTSSGELEYRFASWDAQAAVKLSITDSTTILNTSNERVHQVLQSSLAGDSGAPSTPLLHLAQRDTDTSEQRRGSSQRQWHEEDQGDTG